MRTMLIDTIYFPGELSVDIELCPDCGCTMIKRTDWDTGEKYLECTCIFCTHKEIICQD